MDLATVPESSTTFWASTKSTMSPAAHTTHKVMDLLRLWWESPRNWWKNQWKMENCGTMGLCSIGLHLSALLFHHHWRCWQEEDHIQPFHNFYWVLGKTWKPPGFKKNYLGGNPTLPQKPTWIWTLDNLSLSRKWVETFGKPLLLINQQLSLIHIGWDFQTIPYWEGPGQWSNPGLYLLILSCRLKHSHGTLKEKLAHILQTPSTCWRWSQCCLLHQWQVWPHQQPKIGGSKVRKSTDPIISTEAPQPAESGFSLSGPSVPSTPRCSTKSTKGVPPDRYNPSKK